MFRRSCERFRAGRRCLGAPIIVAAWRRLTVLRGIWADRVAGFDAVLLPTAPILPPDAARLMTDPAYFVAENLLALRNTRIGNLMGLCALTLPTGVPSCGISLMARAGRRGTPAAAWRSGRGGTGLTGGKATISRPRRRAKARAFSGPRGKALASLRPNGALRPRH